MLEQIAQAPPQLPDAFFVSGQRFGPHAGILIPTRIRSPPSGGPLVGRPGGGRL